MTRIILCLFGLMLMTGAHAFADSALLTCTFSDGQMLQGTIDSAGVLSNASLKGSDDGDTVPLPRNGGVPAPKKRGYSIYYYDLDGHGSTFSIYLPDTVKMPSAFFATVIDTVDGAPNTKSFANCVVSRANR